LDDLNTLSASNLGLIVVVLGIVCVLLLLALAILARRVGRIDKRLSGMTRGADGQDLSEILEAHLDKVYAVARDLDEVTRRTTALEAAQPRTFQRIGLVRFNPFEDTGGNQSFAIALLDGRGDGFVISSLHSRSGTRVYGKAVAGGRSATALSDEETQAVSLALASEAGPAKGA
jgi:Protein of unknown function (DUF4446)